MTRFFACGLRMTRLRLDALIPAQTRSTAILRHPALEEVLFLAEVDRLAHPGEGIAGAVLARQPDPLQTPVGDELDVLPEETGVEPEHAVGETVRGVGDLQRYRLPDLRHELVLEIGRPQVRVLGLDAVDQVDAEVEVDRLVAQDV